MEATPATDFTAGDPVSITSTVMNAAGYIVGVPINGMNFVDALSRSSSPMTSSTSTSSFESFYTSSSSSTLAAPTPSSSPTSSLGLSTGAKAGIGVGFGIAAITIVALLTFFLLTRRRRDQHITNEMQSSPQDETTLWKHELQTKPVVLEIGSSHDTGHELVANQKRLELSA